MTGECGKRTYATKPEAERALKTIKRHRNKREDRPMSVYRCPFCRCWHLTSQHDDLPSHAVLDRTAPPLPRFPR